MDWFKAFCRRHHNRHPHPDWPPEEAMPDFFRVWQREFEENRVRELEADAASIEMAQEAPRFPNGHLNTLMAKIRAERRQASAAGPHGHYEDIEVARAGCRECPQCCGNGMVSVPGPDAGKTPEEMPKIPRMTVSAYCGCGLGALIKRLHLEKEPKLATRIRQAPPPEPDGDYAARHWNSLSVAERRTWVEDAATAYPSLKRLAARSPVFLEAAAVTAAYRARHSLHPWPGSPVWPEPEPVA